MKKLSLILFFLGMGLPSFAQTTAVSGQIKDSTGQTYNYGTWSVKLIGPPGYVGPFFENGVQLQNTDISKSGTLDTGGNISVTVFSTNVIKINGSQQLLTQWVFSACPGASANCYSIPLSITGSTFSVTGTIVSPPITVIATPNNQPSAYSDSEIQGAVLGFMYFNLTDQTVHACSYPVTNGVCTWIDIGAGGAVAFNNILPGTNTGPLVIGTGGSLSTSGTGTLAATTSVSLAATPSNCGAGVAATGVAANGNAVGCFTPSGSPAGATNDVQINAGGGVFGVGPLVSTVAIDPLQSDSICFASTNGNDANSGFSWGAAKADIDACWNQLPSTGGAIYATNGVPASTVTNAGLWIMGSTDPNFGSPPAGWVLEKPVAIYCSGPSVNAGFAERPLCSAPWGSSVDNNHPAVWISGTSKTIQLEGFVTGFPGRSLILGICSNQDRTGTCGVQNDTFTYDDFAINQSATSNGPAIDIGSNTFWVRFRYITCAGNTLSSGGITSDNAQCLTINPSTGTGSGLIFVDDSISGGGGLKVYPGSSGQSGLYVNHFQTENNMEAAVWFVAPTSGMIGSVTNVEVADCGVGDCYGVRVDVTAGGKYQPDAIHVSNIAAPLIGPMICDGSCQNTNEVNQIESPLRQAQTGFFGGGLIFTGSGPIAHVVAQDDNSRRLFSPVAVDFTNLVSGSPYTTLFSGTGSTNATIAPDGTSNATRVTCSTSCSVQFYNASQSPTVGGAYLFGVWVRSSTANGLSNSNALQFQLLGSGYNLNSAATSQIFVSQYMAGDGDWQWVWGIANVTAIGTNPVQTILVGLADSTHTPDFYGPVLKYIPAGTLSANEIYNRGLNMASYDPQCPAGTICGLRGQEWAFPGTGTFMGLLTQANTANRQYTFPDGSGIVPLISGAITPGNCTDWISAFQIGDAGFPCDSGGGGSSIFTSFQFGSSTPIIGANNYVQLTYPSIFTATQTGSGTSGSPFIDALGLNTQNANFVWAGPCTGSAVTPVFRALCSQDIPNNAANTTGQANTALTWATARLLAGNSVNGSANVPFANKFIVQGTADSGLTGAQFLGALGTGLVKNTTITGILSIAVASDIFGLWSGTCNSSTFLRGDGACTAPSGSGTVNSGNQYSFAEYLTATNAVSSGPSSPAVQGQYLCGYFPTTGAAVAPTCPQVGMVPRAVTGTTSSDTILYSDNANDVDYQGSVAVAVSLPTPTTLNNPVFITRLINTTSGSATSVTVTSTTLTFQSTGSTTLSIAQGQSCLLKVDPSTTFWQDTCNDLPLIAGANVTITRGQFGPTIATAVGITGVTIAGTANQIAVSGTCAITTSGTCTVGFPSTIVIPSGSTAATQSASDNSTKVATTAYADTAVANGIAAVNPAVAVLAASTANLAGTYSNGAGGIGATFTITATGAFTLDGTSIGTLGQRVLLKNQTSAFQNGVYTATVVGTTGISAVFTRALDYDQPSDINSTGIIPVTNGTANINTTWQITSTVNTVGTDSLTYQQFTVNPVNVVTAVSPGVGLCHFAGSTQTCTSSTVATGDIAANAVTSAKVDGSVCAPGSFASQTDGATVTWAIGSVICANASLTFTTHGGSRTLNITNPVNGGSYVIWLKQDGTGGEGLTLGSGCTWKVSGGGSGAITPSTGANAIDVLAFTYDGTNCYANFNKNFN